MSRVLKVGGLSAEAGKKVHEDVEVAEGFDGNPITMRLVAINGVNPGPRVFIDAGVHGSEVGGVEGANRIVSTIEPEELSGALVVTPCVNVTAFFNGTRRSPIDEKDLNRIFPGDPEGTFSDRLASEFYNILTSTLTQEDYRISLHGGGEVSYVEVPEIPGEVGERCMSLARSTGVGVVEIIERGGFWEEAYVGTIGRALEEAGLNIPGITIESDDPFEAIMNVLRHLRMIGGEPRPLSRERVWLREGRRIYATRRGLWVPKASAGSLVKEGQLFAEVTSANGEVLEDVRCPIDGYVVIMRRKSIIDPLSGVFARPGNYGGLIAKVVRMEENEV